MTCKLSSIGSLLALSCCPLQNNEAMDNAVLTLWSMNGWIAVLNHCCLIILAKNMYNTFFSPGCLSMILHTILRLWLVALTKHDVMFWLLHHARYHKIYWTVHKGLWTTHEILLCPELTSCSDLPRSLRIKSNQSTNYQIWTAIRKKNKYFTYFLKG